MSSTSLEKFCSDPNNAPVSPPLTVAKIIHDYILITTLSAFTTICMDMPLRSYHIHSWIFYDNVNLTFFLSKIVIYYLQEVKNLQYVYLLCILHCLVDCCCCCWIWSVCGGSFICRPWPTTPLPPPIPTPLPPIPSPAPATPIPIPAPLK